MADDAERVAGDRKDPVVKAGDRDLVEHEHNLVHDIGAIEPSASGHARVGLKRVPMSTVTIYDSWETSQH